MQTYEQRQQEQFEQWASEFLTRLQKITEGCRLDMHEPDEQELSATVLGNYLDNASGDAHDPFAGAFRQELVVSLRRELSDGSVQRERFNLASLIALARLAVIQK